MSWDVSDLNALVICFWRNYTCIRTNELLAGEYYLGNDTTVMPWVNFSQ